jgi:hypothetical protein
MDVHKGTVHLQGRAFEGGAYDDRVVLSFI